MLYKKPKQSEACSFAKKRQRKVGCVMRKIFMVLAVLLLAASSWAAVNVTCTAVNPGNSGEVRVSYSVTDSNEIRAFGIRIDVNNNATISNIDVNDKDYYIFPGSIDINDSNGAVNGWGSAVADGGAGENYMILEMGSLYATGDPYGHESAPASSGSICTFEVSRECTVSLSRDTDRGGVVMTDGSDYASLSGCDVSYFGCLPQAHADWTEWDKVGRPISWCYVSQCYGDADGLLGGSVKGGGFYHVGSPDLTALGAGWKKLYQNDTEYYEYEPNALNYLNADFDHTRGGSIKGGGFYRVGSPDLTILGTYWKELCLDHTDPNCTPEDCGGSLGEKYTDKGI
jgi:hypothetical protein